jgi:hypothetical protein
LAVKKPKKNEKMLQGVLRKQRGKEGKGRKSKNG